MGKRSSVENRIRKPRITLHLAGLVVAVCIAMIAGIAIYEPVLAEAIQIRNVTTWTENFLSPKDEVLQDPDGSDEVRLEAEVLSAEAMSRIPDSVGTTEFLATLSQLAAATDLKIHEFRPGDEVDRTTHRELPIHLTGEASYDSLCRFLAGLEKVERLTQLTALQVNGGFGETDTYPVSMTVNIFFAPLPVEAASTGEGDESETTTESRTSDVRSPNNLSRPLVDSATLWPAYVATGRRYLFNGKP
jgi:hypothetical protein